MKTKEINGIMCGYLKLVPYSNGWLAVDEKIQEVLQNAPEWHKNLRLWSESYKRIIEPQFKGDWGFNDCYVIIAASPSLNLPVLRLPEREDVGRLAKEYAIKRHGEKPRKEDYDEDMLHRYENDLGGWEFMTDETVEVFKEGYRAHLATHGYTEQDMRGLARFILQVFNNVIKNNKHLIPIQDEKEGEALVGEMVQTFFASLRPQICWCEIGKSDNADSMYYFKSRDGELIVVEWE